MASARTSGSPVSHMVDTSDTGGASSHEGRSRPSSEHNNNQGTVSSPAIESPQLHIPSFTGFYEDAVPPKMSLHSAVNSVKSSTRGERSDQSREDDIRLRAGSGEADQALLTPPYQSTSKSKEDDVSQSAPAWTELKTKAGKDRKRLPLACIACRRKKIRCSGEHPACKHCVRSRIPCVYKVTTRKAAPRTDYMAMLDKRLKRMEERVIRVLPKEHHDVVAKTGRAALKPSANQDPRPILTPKKRSAEQSVADLERWAKSHDEQPRLNITRTAHLLATQHPSTSHEVDEPSLMVEGIEKLPPKDVQEHLAEVFFDYVYGQSYHLLHKPTFMRQLAHDQIPPVLLLAVCAIAARFSTHPAVRTEPAFLRGEEWAAAAREISLRRYDSPEITVLIVYLILTLHEFGTCQGGRSWMFGGMAQRMAYALQLHQDLLHDPKSVQRGKPVEFTPTERELRRRTMWACFLMDRFCSSGKDRPTFVSTEHIRAHLPVAERLFTRELTAITEDLAGHVDHPSSTSDDQTAADPTDNMGVAAYTIRIIAVWGEAITYYNLGGKQKEQWPEWDTRSDFARLRQRVKAWDEGLPVRLRFNADNLAAHSTEKIANQFIFMHIIYHQTILFINRFALPDPGTKCRHSEQAPPAFLKDCAREAWTAANKVSVLVRDSMAYNVVAPFAGYAAFFSGAVHIQGAFSKNGALQSSSKQHLTWSINYLTKMKKHWGMFHFMTQNLRELYQKQMDLTRNAAGSGGTASSGDTEGIFQYGDWFDRYPHGMNSAGSEQDAAETTKDTGAEAARRSDLLTVEDFFASLSPVDQVSPGQGNKARKQHKRQASRSSGADTSKAVTAQDTTAPGLAHVSLASHYSTPQSQTSTFGPTSYPVGMQPDMSAVSREAQALASMPTYLESQPSFQRLTGYQGELAQLAASSAGPIMNDMTMGFGAVGIPNMPLDQVVYDSATPGAWFMPYNLDPPAIAQATSTFGPDQFSWSTGQFPDLQPAAGILGMQTPMSLDASQQELHRRGQQGGL